MTVTYDTATLTARQTNETDKNIISIATHTDGSQLEITAHGYAVGDLLRVTATNYNGAYLVLEVVDVNNIVINATFSATQTGTAARGDKDHSAFGALTSVVDTDLSVTDFPYHVYNGSSVTLDVEGDMMLDQFKEYVAVGDIVVKAIGGNYIQGVIRDEPENADTTFRAPVPLTSLHIVRRGVGPQNDPGFTVEAGGRHEMNGTMMMLHSAYRAFYTSDTVQAQVRFNDAYIYIEGLANNKPYKVRFDGTDVEINGLQQYRGAFANQRALSVFAGYVPTHYEGWQVPSQADESTWFERSGYGGGGRGNLLDARYTDTKMRDINCRTGSKISRNAHSGAFGGVHESVQKVKFEYVDLDGNSIEGALGFLRNYDNTGRINYTDNSQNENYVTDRTYTWTSVADGTSTVLDVLMSARVDNGSGGTTMYFSKDNDDEDIFDIPHWAYGSKYTPTIGRRLVNPTGEDLTILIQMADDLSVTGTALQAAAHDITLAADGLTVTINEDMDLDDLKDALTYEKVTVTNIELPTVTTAFATTSGKVLDLGAIDITIAEGFNLAPGVKHTSFLTTGIKEGDTTAPYTDSTGSTVKLNINEGSTLVRVEEYDTSDTLLNTYRATADSDGVYSNQYDEDSTLKIYLVKNGFFFTSVEHSVSDGNELDISLVSISHVDTSLDISAFVDETATTRDEQVYFEFSNNKGNWRWGNTTTKGKLPLTIALLYNRVSTQDGLEFFAYFAVQTGIREILGGQPFSFSHDRLEMNTTYMDIIPVPDLEHTETARCGIPVFDGSSIEYVSPTGTGYEDNVEFDNVAVLPIIAQSVLQAAFEGAADNPTFIRKLGEGVWDIAEASVDTGIGSRIKTTLARLLKNDKNRKVISTTDNTETLYDDDGTTALQVWDIKDADGNPAVTGALERDPQ